MEIENQSQKLANNQGTIEGLKPLYLAPHFSEAAALLLAEKVYRVEVGGLRHYVRASGRTYKSLTSFLGEVMPRNKFLDGWRERMTVDLGGTEKMTEWMEQTADYGTALHIAIADYCRRGFVDWFEFEGWAFNYLMGMGLKGGTLSVALNELIKDFASLLQFFHDYRVKVIAVEIPVFTDHGVATLVDIVCTMEAKNYDKTPDDKRERVTAAINLKSGKKGFFEEHQMQLVGERMMFNETFGDKTGVMVTDVFNLAPSDWKKETPTYKLARQTDAITNGNMVKQFEHFISLAKLRGTLSEPVRKFPIFTGTTKYGESPAGALQILTHTEFAARKIQHTLQDERLHDLTQSDFQVVESN